MPANIFSIVTMKKRLKYFIKRSIGGLGEITKINNKYGLVWKCGLMWVNVNYDQLIMIRI